MEYYSAIKRNEVLIHATTWVNLGKKMKCHKKEKGVSERSQTPKRPYDSIYMKYL